MAQQYDSTGGNVGRGRRRIAGGINTAVTSGQLGSSADEMDGKTRLDLDGGDISDPRLAYPEWDQIMDAMRHEFTRTAGVEGDFTAANDKEQFFVIVDNALRHSPTNFGVRTEERGDLTELLKEQFFGMGVVASLLRIDGLEEISINRWDTVFVSAKGRRRKVNSPFRSEQELRHWLDVVFGSQNLALNESNPSQDGVLPDGKNTRIHANLPPMSPGGACASIRAFKTEHISIDKYIEYGAFTKEFAEMTQKLVAGEANMIISGGTGSGKAQPLHAKILTPGGWTTMGEIKPADRILGSDGNSQIVTGVFPQGKKEVYRIYFSDGTWAEACGEHLWSVQAQGGKDWSVHNTLELKKRIEKDKLYIPTLSSHAQFDGDSDLLDDPYQLGIFLGKGRRRHNFDTNMMLDEIKTSHGALAVKIPKEVARTSAAIPREYMQSSLEQREALLQGLMDSSGILQARSNGGPLLFTSKNEQLVDDVVELVQSFGGVATKRLKSLWRTNPIQIFTAAIDLPHAITPFRNQGKLNLYSKNVRSMPHKAIVRIESIGMEETQCIMVSNEDSLYITDNYILTHNTTFINSIATSFIPKRDRVIIIESKKELQVELPDMVYLQETVVGSTTQKRGEEQGKTIRDGIRDSLRMFPDRILVGEVRGHEAYDLLQAMNTGHGGSMCTLHSNSPREAIGRLESMAAASQEPVSSIVDLIGWAVDIVVQISRERGVNEDDPDLRGVLAMWQFFHISKLTPKGKQQMAQIKAAGGPYVYENIKGNIWGLPLFVRDSGSLRGNLVKVNDPVSVNGPHFA